jgi:hypothetical protein
MVARISFRELELVLKIIINGDRYFTVILFTSTAQGGGGSFKIRNL